MSKKESGKIFVKGNSDKVFAFTEWSKVRVLAKRGLIDLNSKVAMPAGGKKREWVAIGKIPNLAEIVSDEIKKSSKDAPVDHASAKTIIDHSAAQTMKVPVQESSVRPAPKPAPSPNSKPAPDKREATRVRKKGKAGPAKKSAKKKLKKPPFLKYAPVLLSVIPGLGQMYSLNINRAYLFCFLFIASLGFLMFNAVPGLLAVLLVVFISMCDAYAVSSKKGFLTAVFKGIKLSVSLYLTLACIVLWMFFSAATIDSVISIFTDGTPALAKINLSGSDPVQRDWNSYVVAAVALGACLLLFLLHGLGRRFIWARSSERHFSNSIRSVLTATAATGLLAYLVNNASAVQVGHILSLPVTIIRLIIDLPATVCSSFNYELSWFSLGFLNQFSDMISGCGTLFAESMSSSPSTYYTILIASLLILLPITLAVFRKDFEQIPAYAEAFGIWKREVKERTETIKDKWNRYRKELAESRAEKRELDKKKNEQALAFSNATNQRLDRLEKLIANLQASQAETIRAHIATMPTVAPRTAAASPSDTAAETTTESTPQPSAESAVEPLVSQPQPQTQTDETATPPPPVPAASGPGWKARIAAIASTIKVKAAAFWNHLKTRTFPALKTRFGSLRRTVNEKGTVVAEKGKTFTLSNIWPAITAGTAKSIAISRNLVSGAAAGLSNASENMKERLAERKARKAKAREEAEQKKKEDAEKAQAETSENETAASESDEKPETLEDDTVEKEAEEPEEPEEEPEEEPRELEEDLAEEPEEETEKPEKQQTTEEPEEQKPESLDEDSGFDSLDDIEEEPEEKTEEKETVKAPDEEEPQEPEEDLAEEPEEETEKPEEKGTAKEPEEQEPDSLDEDSGFDSLDDIEEEPEEKTEEKETVKAPDEEEPQEPEEDLAEEPEEETEKPEEKGTAKEPEEQEPDSLDEDGVLDSLDDIEEEPEEPEEEPEDLSDVEDILDSLDDDETEEKPSGEPDSNQAEEKKDKKDKSEQYDGDDIEILDDDEIEELD